MKKPMPLLIRLFLFLAILFAAGTAESAVVGKAKMVLGKVMIKTASGEETRFRRGNPVSVGDIIVTNARFPSPATAASSRTI